MYHIMPKILLAYFAKAYLHNYGIPEVIYALDKQWSRNEAVWHGNEAVSFLT